MVLSINNPEPVVTPAADRFDAAGCRLTRRPVHERQGEEGHQADRDAEHELPADPLPEDTLYEPQRRPHVEAPGLRQRLVERGDQGDAVLEQVEHPDRQDDVAEDRADDAAGAGEDGQEDREVDLGRGRAEGRTGPMGPSRMNLALGGEVLNVGKGQDAT